MLVSEPPPNLSDEEKAAHPSWRRTTRKYRRKQAIVKNLWIGSALLVLAAPGAVWVVLLGTAFVAFMILDETA